MAGGFFGIWLKSEGFSVVDSNVIPSGTWLISGFLSLSWGYLSDITKSRFTWVIVPLVRIIIIIIIIPLTKSLGGDADNCITFS